MPEVGEITKLLSQLGNEGSRDQRAVLERLMPLVYSELKALASSHRYRWQGRDALGTTSLVHEAYTRLVVQKDASYSNRKQFFAVASKAMRSILIDNARWHRRLKRGGGELPVPLQENTLVSLDRCDELLSVDEALSHLDERDPDLARVVECRCFGGLTTEETAAALDISPATVKRRWSLARTWLYRELRTDST